MAGMTVKHNEKMEGMVSFSTNTMSNPFCNAMRLCKDNICSSCFASRMHKRLPTFSEKLNRNEWIKVEEMSKADVPFINAAYFRFEAFGELETEIQLRNYLLIAKENPHCNFALWTKRMDLLELDFVKPKNLQIMLSSWRKNEQMKIPVQIEKKVDGIFTVYSKPVAMEKKVPINCGDKKCINCLICYKKSRKLKVVNELIK